MKTWTKTLFAVVLGAALAGAAAADTLELRDGRVLQGKYLGGRRRHCGLRLTEKCRHFRRTMLVALTFTRGTSQPQAVAPPPAPAAPAPAPAVAVQPNHMASAQGNTAPIVTIPAGQSLLVRMIDGVDSSKNHVGDIFHASLETDLNVNGQLVARKGRMFTDGWRRRKLLASSLASPNCSWS